MDFGTSKRCKQLYIILLGSYQSPTSPTDSAEEPKRLEIQRVIQVEKRYYKIAVVPKNKATMQTVRKVCCNSFIGGMKSAPNPMWAGTKSV